MSPAEKEFLERAVVQLLFVSGRTFSLESLRDKLRELFLPHPDATVRAAASVGGFELVQMLLKASGRLEKLGLKLDVRGGTVRLTTAPVESPALRDYFLALSEETRAGAAESDDADAIDGGSLGEGALEVLACIAFQQPVGQMELNGYFGGVDKRTVVRRLQHLGLVDCRRNAQEQGGRTLWVTTPEFLRRFGLSDIGELREQLNRQQTAAPAEVPLIP
jgi:chromosome segregation and condensation protein ScpB